MIDDVKLEHRLRRTFDAVARRAISLESSLPAALVDEAPRKRRRPPSSRVVVLLSVGAVAVAVVGLRLDTGRPMRHVAVSAETTRPTTATSAPRVTSAPSVHAGAFPLTEVPAPPGIPAFIAPHLVAGTVPITVRPGTEPPVTVSRQIDAQSGAEVNCESTVEIPTNGAAWSAGQTCGVDGKNQAFVYPLGLGQGGSPPPATFVYYIWSQVPQGTAYVVFQSALLTITQQPIKGIVAVPVKDGPVDAILTAIGTDGRGLGQAHFLKCYDGTHYLPAHVQSQC